VDRPDFEAVVRFAASEVFRAVDEEPDRVAAAREREERERLVRRPPLRWLAGISALTTSLVSWGIVLSRNFAIRSSWRR